MSNSGSAFRSAATAAVRTIGSVLLWSLWLALVIVLGVQIYVASTNELTVPELLLHRFEERLAQSGLQIAFKRTSLDPTGRVLIEDSSISLAGYAEPILTARALYFRVNPWLLAVGKVEAREIRIIAAVAAVPAMLSPSGQPEPIVKDLDATILVGDREIAIEQFTARVAGVAVAAHGVVPLPRLPGGRPPQAVAEFFAQRFPALCRDAIRAEQWLGTLDGPALQFEFAPSESGAPQATVTFHSHGLALDAPLKAHAENIVVTTRVLLIGGAPTISQIDFAADALQLPFDATARGVRGAIHGRLRPGGWQFEPRGAELTAESIAAAGYSARAVSAELFPRPLPRLDGVISALIEEAPLAVSAEADFSTRMARLHFAGAIAPAVLEPLSTRLKVDVRKYFDFAALDLADAEVRLGPGWAFERLTAQAALRRINAYGVIMEEGRAVVEFDGRHFYSPDAYARVGANFARASYDQDLKTREYRFLLQGRLRPLDISPWFHDWWPNFFRQLEFPVSPPNASVDVSGAWREGNRSAVFVFADTTKPVIRGAALDHLRTRLFIRPAFFDGLELLATRGTGTATGGFTVTTDPQTHDWRTFDLKLDSSLDLAIAAQILGPGGAKLFAPFALAAPPEVRLQGHFASAAAAGGARQDLRLETATTGEFRLYGFPLQDVSFTAILHGDDFVIDKASAGFGGGTVAAHARVWGQGEGRRLGFDGTLKGAKLGEAAALLQEFAARRKGEPAAAPGKFVQQKANVHLDLAISAEGRYADALSYRGDGNAVLQGAEIGEVPLLGALSEVIKFTALRFTSARANFKIEGPKLVFSEVALRGANSAIDAHGDYALDRHELDFKAKIFPFQESGNLIKSVVGAVLTPLSNVFEVKLTGSLEKPAWALVLGPTNFLRSLAPEGQPADKPPNPPTPTATTEAGAPPGSSTMPGPPAPAPKPASPPKS